MKNPIIHTDFLANLVDDLNMLAWEENSNRTFIINLLDDRTISDAFDIVDDAKHKLINEMLETDEPSDYNELKQSLSWLEKIFDDLCLLTSLGGETYANPQNIGKSIQTLSELLTLQLQAKAGHNDYVYDEYLCKQTATVLEELCNIIKEA